MKNTISRAVVLCLLGSVMTLFLPIGERLTSYPRAVLGTVQNLEGWVFVSIGLLFVAGLLTTYITSKIPIVGGMLILSLVIVGFVNITVIQKEAWDCLIWLPNAVVFTNAAIFALAHSANTQRENRNLKAIVIFCRFQIVFAPLLFYFVFFGLSWIIRSPYQLFGLLIGAGWLLVMGWWNHRLARGRSFRMFGL